MARKQPGTSGWCGWCKQPIVGKYKVVTRKKGGRVRVHPECRMPYIESREGKSS